MNPLKRLASETAIYGFSTVTARLVNYLLVIYHTRVLDRAEYGVFTELYAALAFLLVLLTYGMETGFFRFSSRADQNPNRVFSTALVSLFTTSLLFFALMVMSVSEVSAFIGYEHNPNYILMLAGIIAIDAFMCIPFARLRYLGKAKLFAALKLSNVLFYVVVSVVLLSRSPSVNSIFLANLLSSSFTLLLLLPTIFSVKISFSPRLLRTMLMYSLPLLVAGLPGIANDVIDRLLFKHLYTDSTHALAQLGVYNANVKLAVLMVIFVQMFRYAAEPFFFSQVKEGSDRRALFADVMKYFVICAMFIFLFVSLYVDAFVYIMGKDYREGVAIVPIMLFANVLLGVVFNLSMWYKLSGKTRYAVYITLPGLVVTTVVNLLFVPRYGYHACAWAHLCSYAAMMVISYALGQRHYPIPYNLRAIAFYIFVGLAIYAIFALCGEMTLPLKMMVATGLIAVYLAVAWRKDGRKLMKKNVLI